MAYHPAKTHQLTITIAKDSYNMIPYIQLFIDSTPHGQANQTLVWNTTHASETSARFVTFSPFSDGMTHYLIKGMLTQCIAWLSPMVNGDTIEIAYSLAAYRAEGVLRNVNGAIQDFCSCGGHAKPNANHTFQEKLAASNALAVMRGNTTRKTSGCPAAQLPTAVDCPTPMIGQPEIQSRNVSGSPWTTGSNPEAYLTKT